MFPFWATLSLDLLARAALSHHHPVLLASTNEPERDGRHVFYAVNHMPKVKKYIPRSIDSTDVFRRCEELIDDFTSEHREVCAGMLGRRNEELHSGGAPFLDLKDARYVGGFVEHLIAHTPTRLPRLTELLTRGKAARCRRASACATASSTIAGR